ncbi:MAG: dicarboxylate/amino acid:cation symporter [Clostridiales bacterium]|nr:dicarboxylate/amino acid:cation symporter [Clostridiales bacterium]
MKRIKNVNITLAIFVGLVLGILVGLLVPGNIGWFYGILTVISSLYMNALKMMIYPLVFCSIVVGIHGIGNMRETGKIGGLSILFFLLTTAFASFLGLILPRILHLGEGVTITMTESTVEATEFTSLLDTVETLIPSNPIASFAEGNMLQVLVFALIIGFTVLSIGEKADPFMAVVVSVNDLSLKIISVVMHFTPLGVFCSIATVVEANGTDTILSLATVMIALYVTYILYALVFYGGLVKTLGKCSIRKFFAAIAPAALNAFGTCSSSATIPISMRCMEEELDCPNEITSLAVPLGATVNMDAVSIVMSFMIPYFATACGIDISLSMMVVVLLANVLLSIGTPGVPGGAIASFAALSAMVGLPAGIMGVYISVNTLADMGATCVNVIGDLTCCQVLSAQLYPNKAGKTASKSA